MDDDHLRDFYAGLAMMSLISVYKDDKQIVTQYARRAYEIAEAMMQEREAWSEQRNGGHGSNA